jgi:hypothetical protein
MKQKSMNSIYSEYRIGNIEREDFEGLIYAYLVNNREKTCIRHWKQDEYEDFISWFYPRLKESIDYYKEKGSSFEAFLNKYILISAKEYHVRTTTNAVIEYSTWSARVQEMYVHEEQPVYISNDTEDAITKMIIDKKGRKNSRRILALILKCYYYVSDDFVEKIAPLIGINVKELSQMLSKIREIRRKKDDNIYLMQERIYCQFYRCIVYENRLSIVEENAAAHEKLHLRLEKARQRLEKMRKRMTSVRKDATNKQVAEVIGITKGTVDASLHRLKERWEIMSKKADLN